MHIGEYWGHFSSGSVMQSIHFWSFIHWMISFVPFFHLLCQSDLFLVHQIWHLFSDSFSCPSDLAPFFWVFFLSVHCWFHLLGFRLHSDWLIEIVRCLVCWMLLLRLSVWVLRRWLSNMVKLCVCWYEWWWTGKINLLLLKSSLLISWFEPPD